jgi:DNA-binding transcriptional LysR family regulator
MSDRLNELAAFLAVADHLSFQRAAVARGVTRSAISHAIRNLEDAHSVRLVNRTTRSVSLTEAGQLLAERLKPAFAEIAQAVDELNRFRGTPFGTLRLTAPRGIARMIVAPVVARLVAKNPDLSVEISADDALVDIVAEGFDAGIRYGESLQQDMIATRIGFSVSFAVVGSPAYFADHPVPDDPQDLLRHRCIRYRFPSGLLFPWEFERAGKPVSINVDGPMTFDDQELMIEAALAGAGLAYVFHERVAPMIADGRLVRCLADWCPPLDDFHIYYANRSHQPAALRALIDLLRSGKPPYEE